MLLNQFLPVLSLQSVLFHYSYSVKFLGGICCICGVLVVFLRNRSTMSPLLDTMFNEFGLSS